MFFDGFTSGRMAVITLHVLKKGVFNHGGENKCSYASYSFSDSNKSKISWTVWALSGKIEVSKKLNTRWVCHRMGQKDPWDLVQWRPLVNGLDFCPRPQEFFLDSALSIFGKRWQRRDLRARGAKKHYFLPPRRKTSFSELKLRNGFFVQRKRTGNSL